MWDWRQLDWMNMWGWCPQRVKDPRKRVLVRAYGLFMYVFITSTLGAVTFNLIMIAAKGSVRGAIINLVTTPLGVMAVQKIFMLLFRADFFSYVMNTLQDLNDRAIALMGEDSQAKMPNRYKRSRLTFIFVGSALFTIVHYNVRPIIVYYTSGERTLAIDMWVPWDERTFMAGWVYSLFHQWIHIGAAMYGMVVLDSYFLTIFEMILAEFDVLKIALKKIDFTAKNSEVSLDFCIKFHQELLILIGRVNVFFIPVQTTQCVMFTLTICFSGFEMLSLSNVPFNKLANLGEVVFAATYILFGYCYQCHCITEQCTELIRAACDNNWYEANLSDRRKLMIFLERAKVPITFGSIIKFDLGCFISIYKTAFSYYQVLQAFDIS